ncbi:MAG: ATP-binding cassette domain-containing protein [Bacteroidetes bacterium]|nr:ATP-binding cassette domain-containing protein [Bacteroidota bacterium]MBU1115888.1 ATP-binding cassette domain-containing protein [Bacteroidota bacterium]MBU1797836.1 ATP-binding cassette domain-containing protein [Bacteroidota bacterium]
MKKPIIEIKNLEKSFGELRILNKISLDVFEGENFIVFGQSGTGKSVLLKCIVGLLIPDGGDILLNGKSILNLPTNELNEIRKSMGFLFQGAALYDSMSVRENLQFPLIRNYYFSKEELDHKVISTLNMVGLESAIDKMPSELSGGMRKRIGLARAIITDPKIMLYDEPTTGLDPITSKEISVLILELQKKLNMTAIVVTHDLLCAEIIADRAIVISNASIIKEGTIKELTSSDNKLLRNFFSNEIIKE